MSLWGTRCRVAPESTTGRSRRGRALAGPSMLFTVASRGRPTTGKAAADTDLGLATARPMIQASSSLSVSKTSAAEKETAPLVERDA